jgi:hypothetical protein
MFYLPVIKRKCDHPGINATPVDERVRHPQPIHVHRRQRSPIASIDVIARDLAVATLHESTNSNVVMLDTRIGCRSSSPDQQGTGDEATHFFD